jgi:hypothetical protein
MRNNLLFIAKRGKPRAKSYDRIVEEELESNQGSYNYEPGQI